jgi:hypothetical protein
MPAKSSSTNFTAPQRGYTTEVSQLAEKEEGGRRRGEGEEGISLDKEFNKVRLICSERLFTIV